MIIYQQEEFSPPDFICEPDSQAIAGIKGRSHYLTENMKSKRSLALELWKKNTKHNSTRKYCNKYYRIFLLSR